MRRIDAIAPFRVMTILERARALEREGARVIHMEIGEPDLPPPPAALEAARAALDRGEIGYTPAAGMPELRQAIADWYRRQYGVAVSPERVLVTPGSSAAFVALYAALLDPGQRVLLPDPGYPCQKNLVRIVGGVPRLVSVGAASRWQLDAATIAHCWDRDTRAAVIVHPGNPTGATLTAEAIAAAHEATAERGGVLIVDEIYQGLVYGEAQPFTALAVSDEIVVVDGFSKRWALMGLRVGWMVVPPAWVDPVTRVMQNAFIAAPTPAQHAALAALACDDAVAAMRAEYDRRRRLLLDALPRLGFRLPVVPDGAFYVWAEIDAIAADAERFCAELLERAHVAITPGADFAVRDAHRFVRFSYACALDDIREGIDRIADFLRRG